MLNRAHFLERQAEKAVRKGKVEDAIRLHKEAADVLADLLQGVINTKVAESVRLQAELHQKQSVALDHHHQHYQQQQHQLPKRDHQPGLGNQRRAPPPAYSENAVPETMSSHTNHKRGTRRHGHDEGPIAASPRVPGHQPPHRRRRASRDREPGQEQLQLRKNIHRRFEEAELLLGQLCITAPSSGQEEQLEQDPFRVALEGEGLPSVGDGRSLPPGSGDPADQQQIQCAAVGRAGAAAIAGKMLQPMNDKVIIEELQLANSHLRQMVDDLFQQLSDSHQENIRLKAEVKALEQQMLAARKSGHKEDGAGFALPRPDHGPRPVPASATAENDDEEEAAMAPAMTLDNDGLLNLPPLELPPTFDFQPVADADPESPK